MRTYCVRDSYRILVLPKSEDHPTPRSQLRICAAVTKPVAVQLVGPPLRICFWTSRMIGTSVPETPINEDGEPQGSPQDIRLAPKIGLGPDIDTKPNTPGVQYPSHAHLRLRVAATLLRHPCTDRLRRGRGFAGSHHVIRFAHPEQ